MNAREASASRQLASPTAAVLKYARPAAAGNRPRASQMPGARAAGTGSDTTSTYPRGNQPARAPDTPSRPPGPNRTSPDPGSQPHATQNSLPAPDVTGGTAPRLHTPIRPSRTPSTARWPQTRTHQQIEPRHTPDTDHVM